MEIKVYHTKSDIQWERAKRITPSKPATSRPNTMKPLPTVAHQMKKYGFRKLVKMPVKTELYLMSIVWLLSTSKSREAFLAKLSKPNPIQSKKPPPRRPMAVLAALEPNIPLNPRLNAAMVRNSSVACPKTIIGPAKGPFLIDCTTVATNTGPGMRAPEKPTIKDEATSAMSWFTIKQQNMSTKSFCS